MTTRSFPIAFVLPLALIAGPLALSPEPAWTQQTAPVSKADSAPADATQSSAKEGSKKYEPRSGQAGKDVIWVPTPEALVAAMLDRAKVSAGDIVYDLGSGDGRTVIAAAKRGAQAFGIEFNPDMVALSKRNAENAGVKNATFIQGDIFASDFSKATVVTMYLLSTLNVKLRPTILNMKPGTRVVSNSFDMGDWAADDTITQGGRAYYWVVPAKVEGKWQTQQGELTLSQRYQMLSGDLKGVPVKGKLEGDTILLTIGNATWSGTVGANRISLTSGGNRLEATRS